MDNNDTWVNLLKSHLFPGFLSPIPKPTRPWISGVTDFESHPTKSKFIRRNNSYSWIWWYLLKRVWYNSVHRFITQTTKPCTLVFFEVLKAIPEGTCRTIIQSERNKHLSPPQSLQSLIVLKGRSGEETLETQFAGETHRKSLDLRWLKEEKKRKNCSEDNFLAD